MVGVGISGADMYPVRERRIPLVTRVSRKQNTYYGKPEIEVLKRAFAGADMIHFFYPWKPVSYTHLLEPEDMARLDALQI